MNLLGVVTNLFKTYKKLPCKGEPFLFSDKQDPLDRKKSKEKEVRKNIKDIVPYRPGFFLVFLANIIFCCPVQKFDRCVFKGGVRWEGSHIYTPLKTT